MANVLSVFWNKFGGITLAEEAEYLVFPIFFFLLSLSGVFFYVLPISKSYSYTLRWWSLFVSIFENISF